MTEKLETFITMKNLKSLYMNLGLKDILEVWRYRRGRETWEFKGKNFILVQLN